MLFWFELFTFLWCPLMYGGADIMLFQVELFTFLWCPLMYGGADFSFVRLISLFLGFMLWGIL